MKRAIKAFLDGITQMLASFDPAPNPEPMTYTERKARELNLFAGDWDAISDEEKEMIGFMVDQEMLRGDWERVGNDLQNAMDKFKKMN